MGTETTLMIAVAVISLLLPLVVIKHMVARIVRHRRGDEAAVRMNEAGRLVIVSLATAVMMGSVLLLGPESIAPHLSAPAQMTASLN